MSHTSLTFHDLTSMEISVTPLKSDGSQVEVLEIRCQDKHGANTFINAFAEPGVLRRELAKANPVNAELLEALRQLVTLEADGWHADENSIEAWEQARAAVARALGQ